MPAAPRKASAEPPPETYRVRVAWSEEQPANRPDLRFEPGQAFTGTPERIQALLTWPGDQGPLIESTNPPEPPTGAADGIEAEEATQS